MLAFDKLTAVRTEDVEFQLQQEHWTAGVGIFFGSRIETIQKARRAVFQAIVLECDAAGDWQVARVVYDYKIGSPVRWNSRLLGNVILGALTNHAVTLLLQFSNGQLEEVTLDDRTLPQLTKMRTNFPLNNYPCDGELGLVLRNGTAEVTRYTAQKQPRRFSTLSGTRAAVESRTN